MPREPESTLVDRVKIYVISSGTGAFTLGDAVRAYRGVEALRDGEKYSYAVENGAQYEIGRGEYVASLTSLTRNPTASSNGGAVVDFPTNSELALTALASDLSVVSAYVDAALAVGFGTWADLQNFASQMADGDETFVSDSDAGTHTDPASGLVVDNAGVYSKQTGYTDPVRLRDTAAQDAQDVVDTVPAVVAAAAQPYVDDAAASALAASNSAAAFPSSSDINRWKDSHWRRLAKLNGTAAFSSGFSFSADGLVRLTGTGSGAYNWTTGPDGNPCPRIPSGLSAATTLIARTYASDFAMPSGRVETLQASFICTSGATVTMAIAFKDASGTVVSGAPANVTVVATGAEQTLSNQVTWPASVAWAEVTLTRSVNTAALDWTKLGRFVGSVARPATEDRATQADVSGIRDDFMPRAEAPLLGNNLALNGLMGIDAVGTTFKYSGTYSYPSGWTQSGTSTSQPVPSIVAKFNPTLQSPRALQLAHSATTTTGTDYQLYQTVDIPEANQNDATQVANFVVWFQRDNASINIGMAAVTLLDASGASLGTVTAVRSPLTPANTTVGSWFPTVFSVPISDASARKVKFGIRTTAVATGTAFTGNAWITGVYFGFGKSGTPGFDRNGVEYFNQLLTAALASNQTLAALTASAATPWKSGTNIVKNALFDMDAVGYSAPPTGWAMTYGGNNAVFAAYSVASLATPFGNTALLSTHYYDGTLHTDIQPGQTFTVPPELQGTAGKLRVVFYVKKPDATIGVSVTALNYDAANAQTTATQTKISTDGVDGTLNAYVYDIAYTATTVTMVVRPRVQAVTTAGTFPGKQVYLTGVTAIWNSATTVYDRNLAEMIDRKVAAGTAAISTKTLVGANDKYLDARGNLLPMMPDSTFTVFGDSLGDQDYLGQMVALYSPARSRVLMAIGGDRSDQILARLQGVQPYVTGLTWATGTIRLRARRPTPARTCDPSYVSNWTRYSQTISEPRYVEFFNAVGRIAKSFNQSAAAATTTSGSATVSAPGHSFVNGEVVYAKVPGATGLYAWKGYFVRNVASGTLELDAGTSSGVPSGTSVSMTGSDTATLYGDWYYDWAYTTGTDHTISVIAKTEHDSHITDLEMGANDFGQDVTAEVAMANLRAAMALLKPQAKRITIPTCWTNLTWTSAQIAEKTKFNQMIRQEFPDNVIELEAWLSTQGDGSANDIADVAAGGIPRSLRADDIHLSNAGVTKRAGFYYSGATFTVSASTAAINGTYSWKGYAALGW